MLKNKRIILFIILIIIVSGFIIFELINTQGNASKVLSSNSKSSKLSDLDNDGLISETITCIFDKSNASQDCYTQDNKYICSGISSCSISVVGISGASLNWNSSCKNEFKTTINGRDKNILFDCASQNKVCFDSDDGNNFFLKGETYYINLFEPEPISDMCVENTLKEFYCNDRNIISATTYVCLNGCVDGACVETIPPQNVKDLNRYTPKELFIVSDNDWKEVLSLVPITTWTEPDVICQKGKGTPEDVCVYPMLIYHEESPTGFDADAIINFVKAYNPSRIILINHMPQELDNILVSQGFSNLERRFIEGYSGYWSNYKDVIYVDDDYELALLASTYASLINAPLIIKNSVLDDQFNLVGRNVICVTNLPVPDSICNDSFSLNDLRNEYIRLTETDKIILTNPNDLNIYLSQDMNLSYSSGNITRLYTKDSLASPILASAKHEIIFTSKENNVGDIDSEFKSFVNSSFPNLFNDANFYGHTYYDSLFLLNYLEDENETRVYPPIFDRTNLTMGGLSDNYVVTIALSSCNYTNISCAYYRSIYVLDRLTNKTTEYSLGSLNTPSISKLYKLYNNKVYFADIDLNEEISEGIFKLKVYDIDLNQISELNSVSISGLILQQLFIDNNKVGFDYIDTNGTKVIGVFNLENNLFYSIPFPISLGDYYFSKEWIVWTNFSEFNSYAYNLSDNTQYSLDLFAANMKIADNFLVYTKDGQLIYFNLVTKEVTKTLDINPSFYQTNSEYLVYNNSENQVILYDLNNDTSEILLYNSFNPLAIVNSSILFTGSKPRQFPINGYLTVIGSTNSIPLKIFDGFGFGLSVYRPSDTTEFADFTGDKYPDMFSGRLSGISISDTSSYIARDIFDNIFLETNKNLLFIGTSIDVDPYIFEKVDNANERFNYLGYNSIVDKNEFPMANPNFWTEKQFIAYFGHGTSSYAGFASYDLPILNNSIVLSDACSTCETIGTKNDSFCVIAFRNGAIAYVGALNIASISETYENMINNFYYSNLNVGQAYALAYASDYITLLGDPTFDFNKPYLLPEPINWEPWTWDQ